MSRKPINYIYIYIVECVSGTLLVSKFSFGSLNLGNYINTVIVLVGAHLGELIFIVLWTLKKKREKVQLYLEKLNISKTK